MWRKGPVDIRVQARRISGYLALGVAGGLFLVAVLDLFGVLERPPASVSFHILAISFALWPAFLWAAMRGEHPVRMLAILVVFVALAFVFNGGAGYMAAWFGIPLLLLAVFLHVAAAEPPPAP